MKKVKISVIAGARPNFIKISPLIKAIKLYNDFNCQEFVNLYPETELPVIQTDDTFFPEIKFEYFLIHTGQHFDRNMSYTFFKELEIPEPDINLGVGGMRDLHQIGEMVKRLDEVYSMNKFDLTILVGDVNSTLAASIVSSRYGVGIAHVEAGLRSFDKSMPEELNRIVTDSLGDYFFISEISGFKNLVGEGKGKDVLFLTGNVMIDSLIYNMEKIKSIDIFKRFGLKSKNYVVLTLHRPSNVDNKRTFLEILDAILSSEIPYPILYPIHPRSRKNVENFGIKKIFSKEIKKGRIFLLEPLGYFEFMNLVFNSSFVMSDSGGIQEETSFLGIPCITLRNNTERPITVEIGTNILAGNGFDGIVNSIKRVLTMPQRVKVKIPLWDGLTAKRVIKHIAEIYS